MLLRSFILVLLIGAVALARTVCPCVAPSHPTPVDIEHACCGTSQNDSVPTEIPACPAHGDDCSHCKGQPIIPADKAVDAPSPMADVLLPVTHSTAITPPARVLASPVALATSPPLRCARHCSFLN